MSHTFTLWNAQQGHDAFTRAWAHAKAMLLAGHRLTLKVEPEKRTPSQNDAIQALVRAIGQKINRTDHDLLRCLLCEQFNAETGRPPQHEPSWDGKRLVDVSNRTSRLEKVEGSDFIEWLKATEAQL